MPPWPAFLASLALAAAQPAAEPATGDGRIFEVPGYVGDWDSEAGDWFAMGGNNIRFSLPQGADRYGFWALIEAAAERGVALRLRFDAAAGRLAEDGRHLVYPLCAIGAASGAWDGDTGRNCPRAVAAATRAEQLLALGIAQSFAEPETARRTLAEALAATPPLSANGQALALASRGDSAETLAADLEPASPAHDRLWAHALADYRRLVLLVPDRPTPRSQLAGALVALGGYEEALAVYREIGRRWPDQGLQTAVSIGSLYRQQGDYRRALAALDDFARTAGPALNRGMKFHYHRAWTLMLLRRDAEALREIELGLASQPDYPGAFQLRSCVRARLGRPADALADQRRANETTRSFVAAIGASTRAELARGEAVIALLEQAVAARRSDPIEAPCEGFWDRWIHPRARSPLIDAHPA